MPVDGLLRKAANQFCQSVLVSRNQGTSSVGDIQSGEQSPREIQI